MINIEYNRKKFAKAIGFTYLKNDLQRMNYLDFIYCGFYPVVPKFNYERSGKYQSTGGFKTGDGKWIYDLQKAFKLKNKVTQIRLFGEELNYEKIV